jgi:predicted glycoside hydrolase/deacetylase ChbG (UPF0249 family)
MDLIGTYLELIEVSGETKETANDSDSERMVHVKFLFNFLGSAFLFCRTEILPSYAIFQFPEVIAANGFHLMYFLAGIIVYCSYHSTVWQSS